jgi:N-formylmaleamate deformylase
MSHRYLTHRYLTQTALADLADIPARSRWVRSAQVRLHVLDYGGDGVPLVVLPGITTPAVSMDFVARALTDLVRPVLVDLRGRGLSDPGPGYSLEDYADDTDAVISALALDRPLLLGHSLGARIACVTAARGRSAVRGTILVDPPMSGGGRGAYPMPLTAFLDQLRQAQRGTDAEEVAQSWPRWPRREQELRARWLASCDEDAVSASHHGFESEDFFDHWPQVPPPTVLLHGADSTVVTVAGAVQAAAANPPARLTEVPLAGHMVFWDNPSAAVDALREAVRSMVRDGEQNAPEVADHA